jgi:enterochelin esterase family protein
MNYARTQGIPFIEDSTANYLLRGYYSSVEIAGDFNNSNAFLSYYDLSLLSGTNLFYYSANYELNARLDYQFRVNGSIVLLDNENPDSLLGYYGYRSELAMPEYIQPWEINYDPNIPHGSVIESSLYSSIVDRTYQLKIYLPPEYHSSSIDYPTVYFQDGFSYTDWGSAVNVLDNIIAAEKIEPIIAVFVKPNDRNEEYAFGLRDEYRLFFVNELVPYIDNLYRTITTPDKRLVLGDSYGGNISTLISYNHPDVFGKCGLHSAAFHPNNYEAYNLVVNGDVKEINFFSLWGSYDNRDANLHKFQDSLIAKGYQNGWLVLPEGHSWGLWRATVDTMLEYFFPYQSQTFQLTVNVTNGWNMVSAPGTNPDGMEVGTWWPRQTGSVFGYNGIQYVEVSDATTGEGYWMNNTVEETYSYPAIEIVPHDPIPVTIGWNMIGGYETSPTITALKATNPQIIGSVFGYNGIQYVEATNLVPGYGYWLNITSEDPIVIPDVLSKVSAEVAERFKQDLPTGKAGWGRIVMTDAAGISTTLYAVNGEVDLDQYTMPPLPPSGSFDIRFSSGRIAEDINGSMQTIDMTGLTYPLTVRVEGMDIRLQDASASAVNVSLKSGEDVVIGDATVHKLMVTGELIPTVYALKQNYPNPFNPTTKIVFEIPKTGEVKLSVYNLLGEEVIKLIDEEKNAGYYEIIFDGSAISSGVYLYKLNSLGFSEAKKMVLIK